GADRALPLSLVVSSALSLRRALPPFPTRRSSDLDAFLNIAAPIHGIAKDELWSLERTEWRKRIGAAAVAVVLEAPQLVFRDAVEDRKSTRLNSSHVAISYAVFCLKKKKNINIDSH